MADAKALTALLQEMQKNQQRLEERFIESEKQRAEADKQRVDAEKQRAKSDKQLAEVLALMSKATTSTADTSHSVNTRPSIDALEAKIMEFVYELEDDCIFESWYARFEDIFEQEAVEMDDKSKVRMLMRHVCTSVMTTYHEHIAPKVPTDYSFKDTIIAMKKHFGKTVSQFERRLQFLNLRMSTSGIEDVAKLAGKVNKLYQQAELRSITEEQLKTTLFVSALDINKYSDIRLRLLNKMKKETAAGNEVKLEDLLEE